MRDYIAEKQRRGVLDFADQVGGAYDIVESAPDVRDELREQHRVVLLDEYQDTSVIQTRFLAELFRDTAVMAVGDPHQSIYGWRGASADNLYAFSGTFSRTGAAQTYSLMTSWRNDRGILGIANRVLEPLQRPGLDVPPLEPRPGAGEGTVTVEFPFTVDEEASVVAGWFAERRAAHEARNAGEAQGGKAHTGAILFRSKRHMQTFAAALAARGIPHRILGLGGLLATPEVVDVVSTLRVVHDPTAGSALIRLLTGPRFGVGVADMAALYDLGRTLSERDPAMAPLPEEVRVRLRSSRGADEAVSIIDAVDVVRAVRDDYRLLEAITPDGRARGARGGRDAGAPPPRILAADPRADPTDRTRAAPRHRAGRQRDQRTCPHRRDATACLRRRGPRLLGRGRSGKHRQPAGLARQGREHRRADAAAGAARGRCRAAADDSRVEGAGVGCRRRGAAGGRRTPQPRLRHLRLVRIRGRPVRSPR